MAEPTKSPSAAADRIGVRDMRRNFSGVLRQVRNGASFVVTSRDEVVAIIKPPSAAIRPKRLPGSLRGEIWMAPDFDELPTDILASMADEAE